MFSKVCFTQKGIFIYPCTHRVISNPVILHNVNWSIQALKRLQKYQKQQLLCIIFQKYGSHTILLSDKKAKMFLFSENIC